MVRIAIALSALACGLGAAQAADSAKDVAFQKLLFGHTMGAGNIHACFQRVYDSDHLAKHPQQNVRTMNLLFVAQREFDDTASYSLEMGVTFRNVASRFTSTGSCGSIKDSAAQDVRSIPCAVACDGGGIDITIKDENAVLAAIPEKARLWRADGGDDSTHEGHRFGADDKLFLLQRTALKDCLSLEDEKADKAQMLRGQ